MKTIPDPPGTEALNLPEKAVALRRMMLHSLRLLVGQPLCILTVATTDLYGEIVQIVGLDETGQVLMQPVLLSGPSLDVAANLHGVTPEQQATVGVPLDEALAELRQVVAERTVVIFSPYAREVIQRHDLALLSSRVVDVQWAASTLAGPFNHTTQRFPTPKLTDALEWLEATIEPTWAPTGTALGNAQRILALTRRAVARAQLGLQEGTYFDCVHGIHNEKKVVDLAFTHGWTDEQARQVLELDDPMSSELWGELLEDAVAYLNTLTPTGYTFGTNENLDWGVYQDSE